MCNDDDNDDDNKLDLTLLFQRCAQEDIYLLHPALLLYSTLEVTIIIIIITIIVIMIKNVRLPVCHDTSASAVLIFWAAYPRQRLLS